MAQSTVAKVLACTFALVFTSAAHAETRLVTLLNLFEKGAPLTRAQAEGAYSGRCFFRGGEYNEDDAQGILWVGRAVPPSPGTNGGPLFPKAPEQMKVNVFFASGDRYVRYDDWTEAKAVEMYRNNGITSTPVVDSQTGLRWFSTYNDGTYSFEARYAQNYIVTKVTIADGKKAGEVAAGCYFFKKLQ